MNLPGKEPRAVSVSFYRDWTPARRRIFWLVVIFMPIFFFTVLFFFFAKSPVVAQTPGVITVCQSGCDQSDLQRTLDSAAPGTRIVLRAGEEYKGNFLLPYKEGSDPIVIESSAMDRLPLPGFRVQATDAEFMPRLVPADRTMPVLRTGPEETYVQRVNPGTDTLIFESDHGYVDGEPIACWADPNPPPGLVVNKTYYVKRVSASSVQISETPGGPPVDLQGGPQPRYFRCNTERVGSHYTIRGIELAVARGAVQEYHLVEMGSSYAMSRAGLSVDLQLDRVYIHGYPDQNGPRMCLLINAREFKVMGSRIEHCNKEGEEGKGITMIMAPGPGLIQNNYIEGGSINLLMGGDFVRILGLVSGDSGGIEIFGNHFFKPLRLKYSAGNGGTSNPTGQCSGGSFLNVATGDRFVCDSNNRWAPAPVCTTGEYFRRADVAQTCVGGACWECSAEGKYVRSTQYRSGSYAVKNLLEIKSGINIYVHGNVFENNWPNADQSGIGVMLVSQVSQYNANGWVRGENITFANNILRNSSQGLRVSSEGNTVFGASNRNVRVLNNLLYDIGATATPSIASTDARPISFAGECVDCQFTNNTVVSGVSGGTGLYFDTKPITNFRFTNNIFSSNRYGVLGDGGLPLSYYLPGKPVMSNNVMESEAPDGQRFAPGANRIVGPAVDLYTDRRARNFRLKPTSPFSAACTTGCEYTSDNQADVGADLDRVEQETSGAVAGTPNWNDLISLRVESVEATKATLVYYIRDDQDRCTLAVSTNPSFRDSIADVDPAAGDGRELDNREGNLVDGAMRTFIVGTREPLTPETQYYFRLRCASGRQSGAFKTVPAPPPAP